MLLATNSRSNETLADNFAHKIGFGKELISALYILQKTTTGGKLKLSELFKSSHPYTAYRIEYLETLENRKDEQIQS